MTIGFSINVSANKNAANINGMDNIKPYYVVSCPSGGKHYMQSIGLAKVHLGAYPSGTLIWPTACCYQCIYCYDFIATKTPVNNRDPIGEYAEYPVDYALGTLV